VRREMEYKKADSSLQVTFSLRGRVTVVFRSLPMLTDASLWQSTCAPFSFPETGKCLRVADEVGALSPRRIRG
jgi:hypothetical protein